MDMQGGQNAPEQSWVVDLFKPEDAEGVVGLYRAIYGETFPKQEVYMADWHVQQARTHDSYRVVARTDDGAVIATGALYRSAPNPELYEGGGIIALPEYGRTNAAVEVSQFVLKKVPPLFDIRQLWGECVCNHLFTQMYFIKDGGVACALEVDLLPDGSFKSQAERGLDREGRVSALIVSRIYHPTAQTVYLPKIYESALQKIYEPFPFEPTYLEARQEFLENKKTDAWVDTKETAGISRITVYQIGSDFADWLRQTEGDAMQAGAVVFQIIMPLNTPVIGGAAEYLKNEGYWLGGVMSGWFGADGLLMQKTLHQPDFGAIKVYSKPGKAILEMVKADYDASRR